MLRFISKTMVVTTALCAFAACAAAAPIFQLIPASGALFGAPGSVVGWGFNISNSSGFLQITNSEFCEGAQTPPCTSSAGAYTDFIATNFTVIGPAPESPVLMENFNANGSSGVGSLAINSSAAPGLTSGQILLTYDLYTVSPNDPLFNPFDAAQVISTGNTVALNASVSVAAATPEPGNLALAGLGLCIFAMLGRGRKRRVVETP